MSETDPTSTATTDDITLRRPRLRDGREVHALIGRCPPLDLNSSYAYFLLCDHHAGSCVIAERKGRIVGFLSAYLLPQSPQTLFLWQAAVDEAARGCGLAGRMVDELLGRPACAGVRHIETTVSPSNTPSRRLFERIAEKYGADRHEETYLTCEDFGGEDHEEEALIRIGPLPERPSA